MEDSTTLSLTTTKEVALKDIQEDEYYQDIQPQGLRLSLKNLRENPYPGLRPFKTSETNVFFGRKDITLDLIARLANRRFLAVLGASGTGKSSLVRAGLLPGLKTLPGRHGFWNVAICRPGKNPFGNLSKAIAKANLFTGLSDYKIWESIATSSYGYEELYDSTDTLKEFSTLIVIDQFEELFRYRKEGGVAGKNDASLFVKMLIDISKIEKLNTYVMITMRSEFLGDCVQFSDLVEEINSGQFLVPKLTGKQLKDAIIEPSGFSQASVEKVFADRLLGEIGDNMDQLPVLQHALRRSYEEGKKHVAERGEMIVKYEDYEMIGRTESAINQHANEIFESFNDVEKLYCQLIFQLITDKATDGRGTRRPLSFSTIFAICKEDKRNKQSDNELRKLLTEVIDRFRADTNNFLMPPFLEGIALTNEIELDLSHESIMRIWENLITWIEVEAKDADLLKQLINRRTDDYLQGETLDTYNEWINTKKESYSWALLYKPASLKDEQYIQKFKDGIGLVEKSLQLKIKTDNEKAETIKRQIEDTEKIKNRNRINKILIAASIILLVLSGWAYTQKVNASNSATAAALSEEEARRSAKAALNSAKEAQTQRKIALVFADSTIKYQKDLADKELEFLRAKASLDAKEKQLSEFKNDSLQVLIAINDRQRDSLQTQVDINSLQKLPFYSSSYLDSSDKEKVVKELLPLKKNAALVAKFEIVKQSINYATKAEEIAATDQNKAFFLVQKANQLDSNFLVNKITNDILNRYVFFKQRIYIGNLYDMPLLKSVANRAIVFHDNYINKIGYYKNGVLDFGKWIIKDDNNEDYFDASETISIEDSSGVADSISTSSNVTVDTTFASTNYTTPPVYLVKANALFGKDKIIFLENNKLYLHNVDSNFSSRLLFDSLPNTYSPTAAYFSQDGATLVSVDQSQSLKHWFLNEDRIYKVDTLSFKPSANGNIPKITNLKFARNGQEFAVQLNYDSIQLWSIQKKLINAFTLNNFNPNEYGRRNSKSHSLSSMIVSDSGNYIFAIDNPTQYNGTPVLWARDGKRLDIDFLKINFYTSFNAAISPTGKFLFWVQDNKSYLADIQNKSIKIISAASARKNAVSDSDVPFSDDKKVYNIKDGVFLDDETLLTYDNNGEVRLWLTNPMLQTRSQVLNQRVLPELSSLEKFQLGLIDLNNFLAANDSVSFKKLLDELLPYTENLYKISLENLKIVKILYSRIYGTDYLSTKKGIQTYLLINLLENKFEKYNTVVNYYKIGERLKDIIKLSESKRYPEITNSDLAYLYAELSWNQLFTKEYDSAYQTAKIAIRYDSTNSMSIKNLALSSLLNNKLSVSEAERIYTAYSNTEFDDIKIYSSGFFYNYYENLFKASSVTYGDLFMKDFNILASSNLISLKDPRISRIIELLKDKQ